MAVLTESAALDTLVPAVTRAAAIMDLLATARGPMGISAIARRLSLPKSSVANLCSTLVDTGLLRNDAGGVRLGSRLAHLGAAYLDDVDEVSLFHRACDLLSTGRDHTVQLAVLGDGIDVVYLAKRDGVYPVRVVSTPGRTLPATCTATGKAMLAALDTGEARRRLAAAQPLPRLTRHSITSSTRLLRELAEIRATGHATDREEVVEGVVCIAAVIPSRHVGDALHAVSITLLAPHATVVRVRRLATEVRAVAASVAEGLGVIAAGEATA